MFKKLLAILLTCLMLLPCGVAMAGEAEALTSGDYKYTISGDGSATITRYTGVAEELTVPEELDGHPVTSIGDWAFSYCKSLTSIALPDGLTSIGNWAFSGCDSLTSITLPDSLNSIGANSFASCYQLTRINVSPDHPTLATIDGVLFEKATRTLICYPRAFTVESYAVPQGIQAIGDYAFYGCDSLTSITLPDDLASIGNEAFYGCDSLTSITLPDGLASIGNEAFYGCDSLTSITLPDGLTSIGANPFAYCDQLTRINVSPDHPTLATIDGVLFEKPTRTLICYPCTFTAKSYTVPQGIQAIGDCAFRGCDSLTSITLPDSLTSIGDRAFYDCDSLTSITLPDGLTSIGNEAFNGCASLTSITLPDGLTSIGAYVFYFCDSLKSITLPDSLTSIGYQAFAECPNLTLTVPRDSYAVEYAKVNNLPYTHTDSTDWLNG